MTPLLPPELGSAGIRARLVSVSALAARAGRDPGPVLFAETDADQAALARAFDDAEYPGLWYADFRAKGETRDVCFRCVESLDRPPRSPFPSGRTAFDGCSEICIDESLGPAIPESGLVVPNAFGFDAEEILFEAALLSARCGLDIDPDGIECPRTFPSGAERDLLDLVLTSERPEKALALLLETGFVRRFWPEIDALTDVEHSREHHPEGGAWLHTLETFRYRKRPGNLAVSMALLLHDIGKPESKSGSGKRFDRHAELGASVARRFLERLGYPARFVGDVCFMVRHHMMPEALPRLPLSRTQEALESPVFPSLLEVYRCDVSSTFRGPGGYYEACKAYRAYLRNVKNPYRDAEGRKLAAYWLDDRG